MVKFNGRALLVIVAVWVLMALPAAADPGDEWWDEAWPYRMEVTASGSGVVQATVDFSENGMEITSEDGDGVYSIQGGDSAEIPAEFPADVYVPDDASVILVSDSPNGFVVGLSTETALPAVVEAYLKEMSAAGWNKMTETVMDGGRMTVYLKDERSVSVGIFEEDGAREISLSVSK